jgi:hypothetical protein
MKTIHLFASAAVAGVVLVMTTPAQAQVLGGAVRGGAGGAFAGSFGSFGGVANTNGHMSAGPDTSFRVNTRAQRTAAERARDAAKVASHGPDTAAAAVRTGRDNSEAVARGAMVSGATGAREVTSLGADSTAETATTATLARANGNALAGASNNAQPASRPGNSVPSSGRAPGRSDSPATQSTSGTRNSTGSHGREEPRSVTTQADTSASASADASASVSTAH